mgnify:FL=1
MLTEIEFTQFLRPNGRRRQVRVQRPEKVTKSATAVVAAGGRFESEELMDGTVSMTVEHPDWERKDRGPVAIELCPNGPSVPETVDKLVMAALSALTEKAGCR